MVVRQILRALRHPDHLSIVQWLAPEAKQHKVGFAKSDVVGTGIAVVKDVLVQQRVQLHDGDIEVTGGFHFCVKLFQRLHGLGHICFRIPSLRNAGEL